VRIAKERNVRIAKVAKTVRIASVKKKAHKKPKIRSLLLSKQFNNTKQVMINLYF